MNPAVYIDGVWNNGNGETVTNFCPSTGETTWSGSSADKNNVENAITSARQAFIEWSLRPQTERNEIVRNYAAALTERKTQIAEAISRDMGKPSWEALTETATMVAKIEVSIKAMEERAADTSADTAFGSSALRHRAHGVMAVFGPFNFPGHLPNGHIVPALLAGNTCVFKPSEQAPSVAHIMADAFEAAGLPPGCLNIVQGARETGAALLEGDINGLLFTGSYETGRFFHQHFAGRPEVILALEMGGNSPIILDQTKDIDQAVDVIFHSAFITSGQRCTCARRLILVENEDTETVLSKLVKQIDTISIGLWNDEEVFIGPLVSEASANTALEFEENLIKGGAQALKRLERDPRSDALLRPGLIDVTPMKERLDKELFGPLLQVIRVKSPDEALTVANDTKFGLAAGVITDDDELWTYYRDRLRVGILNRNRPTTGASGAMPFGGPGYSGNFRPGAYYAADYCAWPQASQISPTPAKLSAPGYPNAD